MAWKLCSARADAKHQFKEGDQIRLRSGSTIRSELTLVRRSNSKLQWREEGAKECFMGWSRDFMTREGMSEMGDFYGCTIDMYVPSAFDKEVTCNVKEVPPNTLVLVGKQFTQLVDGLRLVFKPYDSNPERREFTAVVSRHGSGNHLGVGECMQIHVQHDGKPYTTITFADKLDSRTAQDLTFFEKFSCYWVKNYQKAETVEKAPTTVQGKVVTDDDPNGKYIVWCPTSDLPPRNINNGQKQAKAVAASMSERYGKTFYWCRLMGKVDQEVVKTTTTKITTL